MWISSTENERWSEDNKMSDIPGVELKLKKTIVKPLFGWGCCISEICAMAIFSLSEEKQKEVFDELFSQAGCGFDYCRLSIGANDFAESWYSYNETEGDYEMQNFSIDRDRKYIIPAIKEAQKRSPEITFFASPWSPPTWMKFPKVYNYGKLVQTDKNLKAYALYFRKFLEEYAKEGIKISQITPQNEIFADQKFPSCVFNEEEFENFISNYLIDEIGELVDIWFGTINGPAPTRQYGKHNGLLNRFMQNEKCKEHIKGVAYQYAGKFAIMQACIDYPHLDFIQSECECGDGDNTWDFAMYNFEMISHYTRFGARANVYWNMALDNNSYSTWGWRQNSLITVKDGEFTYTPDFYLFKHLAKFIKRGAMRIETEGELSSNSLVYRNVDGSRVAVIMNPFDNEKIVSIEGKNYVLKARSFNTIIL